ncbi:hypothetical protein GMRT_13162 [Giardia muris]|uniref:Uncharacterized protein n=1 Tax=Giardia muris TaxID=5742 RepID=A0A4Z1SLY9_GIAMU|nr:hypothetical protein GMRT_13162 [Giardia muris]|eukprot:TNJ26682.1 hypothetical protein GMRT_13162 [Giardia muris]
MEEPIDLEGLTSPAFPAIPKPPGATAVVLAPALSLPGALSWCICPALFYATPREVDLRAGRATLLLHLSSTEAVETSVPLHMLYALAEATNTSSDSELPPTPLVSFLRPWNTCNLTLPPREAPLDELGERLLAGAIRRVGWPTDLEGTANDVYKTTIAEARAELQLAMEVTTRSMSHDDESDIQAPARLIAALCPTLPPLFPLYGTSPTATSVVSQQGLPFARNAGYAPEFASNPELVILRRKKFAVLQAFLGNELRYTPTFVLEKSFLEEMAQLHADLIRFQEPLFPPTLGKRFAAFLDRLDEILALVLDHERRLNVLKLHAESLETLAQRVRRHAVALEGKPFIHAAEVFVHSLLPLGLFAFNALVYLQPKTFTEYRLAQLLSETRDALDELVNVAGHSRAIADGEVYPLARRHGLAYRDTLTRKAALYSYLATTSATVNEMQTTELAEYIQGRTSQDWSSLEGFEAVRQAGRLGRHYHGHIHMSEPDEEVPILRQQGDALGSLGAPHGVGSMPTVVREERRVEIREYLTDHSFITVYMVSVRAYAQLLTRLTDECEYEAYLQRMSDFHTKFCFSELVLLSRSDEHAGTFSLRDEMRLVSPIRMSLKYDRLAQTVTFDGGLDGLRAGLQPYDYLKLLMAFVPAYNICDFIDLSLWPLSRLIGNRRLIERLKYAFDVASERTYEFLTDQVAAGHTVAAPMEHSLVDSTQLDQSLSESSSTVSQQRLSHTQLTIDIPRTDSRLQSVDTGLLTDLATSRIIPAAAPPQVTQICLDLPGERLQTLYSRSRLLPLVQTVGLRAQLALPLFNTLSTVIQRVEGYFQRVASDINAAASDFLTFYSSNSSIKAIASLQLQHSNKVLTFEQLSRFILFQDEAIASVPDFEQVAEILGRLDSLEATLRALGRFGGDGAPETLCLEQEQDRGPGLFQDVLSSFDLGLENPEAEGVGEGEGEDEDVEGLDAYFKLFAVQDEAKFLDPLYVGPAVIDVAQIARQLFAHVVELKADIRDKCHQSLRHLADYLSSEVNAVRNLLTSFVLDPNALQSIIDVKAYLTDDRVSRALRRALDWLSQSLICCFGPLSVQLLQQMADVEKALRTILARSASDVVNTNRVKMSRLEGLARTIDNSRTLCPCFVQSGTPSSLSVASESSTSFLAGLLIEAQDLSLLPHDSPADFFLFEPLISLLELASAINATAGNFPQRLHAYRQLVTQAQRKMLGIAQYLSNHVGELMRLGYHDLEAAEKQPLVFQQRFPHLSANIDLSHIHFEFALRADEEAETGTDASNEEKGESEAQIQSQSQLLDYERDFLLSLAIKTSLPIYSTNVSRTDLFGPSGGIDYLVMGDIDFSAIADRQRHGATEADDPRISLLPATGDVDVFVRQLDELLAMEVHIKGTIRDLRRVAFQGHHLVEKETQLSQDRFYVRPVVSMKTKNAYDTRRILLELRLVLREFCIIQLGVDRWNRYVTRATHGTWQKTISPIEVLLNYALPLCSIVINLYDLRRLHGRGVDWPVSDYPSDELIQILEQNVSMIRTLHGRINQPERFSIVLPFALDDATENDSDVDLSQCAAASQRRELPALTYAPWTEYLKYAQELQLNFAAPVVLIHILRMPNLFEYHYHAISDFSERLAEDRSDLARAGSYKALVLSHTPSRFFLSHFEKDHLFFSALVAIANNVLTDEEALKQLKIIDGILHSIILECTYDIPIGMSALSQPWNRVARCVLITPPNADSVIQEALASLAPILNNIGYSHGTVRGVPEFLERLFSHIAIGSQITTTRYLPPRYQAHREIIQQQRYTAQIEAFARYLECTAWLMSYLYKALVRCSQLLYALLQISVHGSTIETDARCTFRMPETAEERALALAARPLFHDSCLIATLLSHTEIEQLREFAVRWMEICTTRFHRRCLPMVGLIYDKELCLSLSQMCRELTLMYGRLTRGWSEGLLNNLQLITRYVTTLGVNPPEAVMALRHSNVFEDYVVPTSNPVRPSTAPKRIIPLFNGKHYPSALMFVLCPNIYCGNFLIVQHVFRGIPSLSIGLLPGVDSFLIDRTRRAVSDPYQGPVLSQIVGITSVDEVMRFSRPCLAPIHPYVLSDTIVPLMGEEIARNSSLAWAEFTQALQKYERSIQEQLASLSKVDGQVDPTQPPTPTAAMPGNQFLTHEAVKAQVPPNGPNKVGGNDFARIYLEACKLFDEFFTSYHFRSIVVVISTYIRTAYTRILGEVVAGNPAPRALGSLMNLLGYLGKAIEQGVICGRKGIVHRRAVVSRLREWFDLLADARKLFSQCQGPGVLSIVPSFPLIYLQHKQNRLCLTSDRGSYAIDVGPYWFGAANLFDAFLRLSPRQLGLMNKILAAIFERSIVFLVCNSEKGHGSTELFLVITALTRYLCQRPTFCLFSEFTFARNMQHLVAAILAGNIAVVIGLEYLPNWQLLELCTFAENLREKRGPIQGVLFTDPETLVTRAASFEDFKDRLGTVIFFVPEMNASTCVNEVYYVEPNTQRTGDAPVLPLGSLGNAPAEVSGTTLREQNVSDYYDYVFTSSTRLDTIVLPFRVRTVINFETESPEQVYIAQSPEFGRAFYEISTFLRACNNYTYRFVASDIQLIQARVKDRSNAFYVAALTLDLILRQNLNFVLRPLSNANLPELFSQLVSSAFGLDKVSTVQLHKMGKAFWGYIKTNLYALNMLSEPTVDETSILMRAGAARQASTINVHATFTKYFTDHISKYVSPRFYNYIVTFSQLHQLPHLLVTDVVFTVELLRSGRPLLAVVPQTSYVRAFASVLCSLHGWHETYVIDARSLQSCLKRITIREGQAALKVSQANLAYQEAIHAGKPAEKPSAEARVEELIIISPPTVEVLRNMMDQITGMFLHYPVLIDELNCTFYQIERGRGPYFMICISPDTLREMGDTIGLFTNRAFLFPSIEGSSGCAKLICGSFSMEPEVLLRHCELNTSAWQKDLSRMSFRSPDLLLFSRGYESRMLHSVTRETYLQKAAARISALPIILRSIVTYTYNTFSRVLSCVNSIEDVFAIRAMFYYFLLRLGIVDVVRRPLQSDFLETNLRDISRFQGDAEAVMNERIIRINEFSGYTSGAGPMAQIGTFGYLLNLSLTQTSGFSGLEQVLSPEQLFIIEHYRKTFKEERQIAMQTPEQPYEVRTEVPPPPANADDVQLAFARQAVQNSLQCAFYGKYASNNKTFLADEIWPFPDVAGFATTDFQAITEVMKSMQGSGRSPETNAQAVLERHSEGAIPQLGLGFCGSLSFDLTPTFALNALFTPSDHFTAFANITVPIVAALWNACSLFTTIFGNGKIHLQKGPGTYTKWLARKYADSLKQLRNPETDKVALHGLGALAALVQYERDSDVLDSALANQLRTNLGNIPIDYSGVPMTLTTRIFTEFMEHTLSGLPKDLPSKLSFRGHDLARINSAETCFGYIDYSGGLNTNQKSADYNTFTFQAEFRLYEFGFGVLRNVHDVSDRTLLERDIHGIAERFLHNKYTSLKAIKKKANLEHQKLLRDREDAMFTRLMPHVRSRDSDNQNNADAVELRKLARPQPEDPYMSSDEDDGVPVWISPEEAETDDSDSEGGEKDQMNAAERIQRGLPRSLHLTSADRLYVESHLLQLDSGESTSVQNVATNPVHFSPHHCALIVAMGCAMLTPSSVCLTGPSGSGKTTIMKAAKLVMRDLIAPEFFLLTDGHSESTVQALIRTIAARCLQRNYVTAARARLLGNSALSERDDYVLDYTDTYCYPSLHLHCSDIRDDAPVDGHLALLLRDHMVHLDEGGTVPSPIYIDAPFDLKSGVMTLSDISLLVEGTSRNPLVKFCSLTAEMPAQTESFLVGLYRRSFPQQPELWFYQYVSGFFLARGSFPESLTDTYPIFCNMVNNLISAILSGGSLSEGLQKLISEADDQARIDGLTDESEPSIITLLRRNGDSFIGRTGVHTLFGALRGMPQIGHNEMTDIGERFASLCFLGYLDSTGLEPAVPEAALQQQQAQPQPPQQPQQQPPSVHIVEPGAVKHGGSGRRTKDISKPALNVAKRDEGPWSDVKAALLTRFALYPSWEAYLINRSIHLGRKLIGEAPKTVFEPAASPLTRYIPINRLLNPTMTGSYLGHVDGIIDERPALLSLSYHTINAFWFAHMLLLVRALPTFDPFLVGRVFHTFLYVRSIRELNQARFQTIIRHPQYTRRAGALSGLQSGDPFHAARMNIAKRAVPFSGKIYVSMHRGKTNLAKKGISQELLDYMDSMAIAENRAWNRTLRKATSSLVVEDGVSAADETLLRIEMLNQARVRRARTQGLEVMCLPLAALLALRPSKCILSVINGTNTCYDAIVSSFLAISGFELLTIERLRSLDTLAAQGTILIDLVALTQAGNPIKNYLMEMISSVVHDSNDAEFLLLITILRLSMALALGVHPTTIYPVQKVPRDVTNGFITWSCLNSGLPYRVVGNGRDLALLPAKLNSWSGLRGKSVEMLRQDRKEKLSSFLLPAAHDIVVTAPRSLLISSASGNTPVYELLARTIEPLCTMDGLFSAEEALAVCTLACASVGLRITPDRRFLPGLLSLNFTLIVVDDLPLGSQTSTLPTGRVVLEARSYSDYLRIPYFNSIKSPAFELLRHLSMGLRTFRQEQTNTNKGTTQDAQKMLLASNSNVTARRQELRLNLLEHHFTDILSIFKLSRCGIPADPPNRVFRRGNTARRVFLATFKYTYVVAAHSIYAFAFRFTRAPIPTIVRFTRLCARLTDLIYQRLDSFFGCIETLNMALMAFEGFAASSKTKCRVLDLTRLSSDLISRIVASAVAAVERQQSAGKAFQSAYADRTRNLQAAVAEAVVTRDILYSIMEALKVEIRLYEAIVQVGYLDAILCAAYLCFSQTECLPEDVCYQCLLNGDCGDVTASLRHYIGLAKEGTIVSAFTAAMVVILNSSSIEARVPLFKKTQEALLQDHGVVGILGSVPGRPFFLSHMLSVLSLDTPMFIIMKALNIAWKPRDPEQVVLNSAAIYDLVGTQLYVVTHTAGLATAALLEGLHKGYRGHVFVQDTKKVLENLADNTMATNITNLYLKRVIRVDLTSPPDEFKRALQLDNHDVADSALREGGGEMSNPLDVEDPEALVNPCVVFEGIPKYSRVCLIHNFGAPTANLANISVLRSIYFGNSESRMSLIFELHPGVDFMTAATRSRLLTQDAIDRFSALVPIYYSRTPPETGEDQDHLENMTLYISSLITEALFGERTSGRAFIESFFSHVVTLSIGLFNLARVLSGYLTSIAPGCDSLNSLYSASVVPEHAARMVQVLSFSLKSPEAKEAQLQSLGHIIRLGASVTHPAIVKHAFIAAAVEGKVTKLDIDTEFNIACLEYAVVMTTGAQIARSVANGIAIVVAVMEELSAVHFPATIFISNELLDDLKHRLQVASQRYSGMLLQKYSAEPLPIPKEQMVAKKLVSLRLYRPMIHAVRENPAGIKNFLSATIMPRLNEQIFRLVDPRMGAALQCILSVLFFSTVDIFGGGAGGDQENSSMRRACAQLLAGRCVIRDMVRMATSQQLANAFLLESRFSVLNRYTKQQLAAIEKYGSVTEIIPEICTISPRITYAWLVVTILSRYNSVVAEALPWFAQNHSSFVALALTDKPLLAALAYYAQQQQQSAPKRPGMERLLPKVHQEALKKNAIVNLPPNMITPTGIVIFAMYCIHIVLRPEQITEAGEDVLTFMSALVGDSPTLLYNRVCSNASLGTSGINHSPIKALLPPKASETPDSSDSKPSLTPKQRIVNEIQPGFECLLRFVSCDPTGFRFPEKLISDDFFSLFEMADTVFDTYEFLRLPSTTSSALACGLIFYDSCIAVETVLQFVLLHTRRDETPIRLLKLPTLADFLGSIVILPIEMALGGYVLMDRLMEQLIKHSVASEHGSIKPFFILVSSCICGESMLYPPRAGRVRMTLTHKLGSIGALKRFIDFAHPTSFYLRMPTSLVTGFTHTFCLAVAITSMNLRTIWNREAIPEVALPLNFTISLRGLVMHCFRQAILAGRESLPCNDVDTVNLLTSCMLKGLSQTKYPPMDLTNFARVSMADSAQFNLPPDSMYSTSDCRYLTILNRRMAKLTQGDAEGIEGMLLKELVVSAIEAYDRILMRQLRDKMKAREADENRKQDLHGSSDSSEENDNQSTSDSRSTSASSSVSGASSSQLDTGSRQSSRSSVSGISDVHDDFDDSVSQALSSVSKSSSLSTQSTTIFRRTDGGLAFAEDEYDIYSFLLLGIKMTDNCLDGSTTVSTSDIEKSVINSLQPKRRKLLNIATPNLINHALAQYKRQQQAEAAQGVILKSGREKVDPFLSALSSDLSPLDVPLVVPKEFKTSADLELFYTQLELYNVTRLTFNESPLTDEEKDYVATGLGHETFNLIYRIIISSPFLHQVMGKALGIVTTRPTYQADDMKAMPHIFKNYLVTLRLFRTIHFGMHGNYLSGAFTLDTFLSSTFNLSALKTIDGHLGFGAYADHWIISGRAYNSVLGDVLNYLRMINAILLSAPLVRQKVVVLLKKPQSAPRILADGSIVTEKDDTRLGRRPLFYITIRGMELVGAHYDSVLDTICDVSPESRSGYGSAYDLYACCATVDDNAATHISEVTGRQMRLPTNIVPVPLRMGGYCQAVVYVPNRTTVSSEEWRRRNPRFVARMI